MKVSVIITTYNRPLLLQRACESVFNQSRIPEEVVIVDNGSAIPVEANLEYLNNREPDIKVHRFDIAQGVCKARNQGAKIASGDILMFLDDDDTWEVSKISDQLSVFKSDLDIFGVGNSSVDSGAADSSYVSPSASTGII